MTLWQKLWARFKGWLFIAEEKEPESVVNEPAINPVGRFSTTVYPPVLKRQPQTKTTDELLAEIRARKAVADAKEAAKQTSSTHERQAQGRVLRTPPPEPVIVHHVYDREPVVDNTATNLLLMGMMLNNQPTVQPVEQPAQVEIIMPQVPQPVCEPVREEPIRYSRPEPVYCAPEPEPYRAPDPEPTYSSPEPSYSDTSSSDSSSSYTGD